MPPKSRVSSVNIGADLFDNQECRNRYQAYSKLQSTAVAFGESLPIPEIVAIGGQSDGKSSLMEAFLGFRFNICSSEMGTRRPLIVQMLHDAAATEPRCRLQDEDSSDYGDVLPEGSIAGAIRDRTESHLRRIGAPVSSKPIVMRAEYAFCPNLTIIDTPGFIMKARAGEAESTPDDILAMVKEQCAPPHRLILFLQQSSVEWCSSLWMHVLQEVDPTFSRTVMVASKFDNRLKEFTERWEVEKYLAAAGYLPQNVKPFFVALPKVSLKASLPFNYSFDLQLSRKSGYTVFPSLRLTLGSLPMQDRSQSSSAEWRQAIQAVDSGIKTHLRTSIQGGYDEERFGDRIGFGNLKCFLEDELAARYRDAAPATLTLLHQRCAAVEAELKAAEKRLHCASDVAALRCAAIRHTLAVAARVSAVMAGFGGLDHKRYGMTTEEERTAAGTAWPGLTAAHQPTPPNATLRLFGGAAFERCLQEFRRASAAITFPEVSRDRVANMLLAQRSRGDGAGAAARAAEELARTAARDALAPLLDAACARLAAVVRGAYTIAAELESATALGGHTSENDSLRHYVGFHSALRAAFDEVIAGLEHQAKEQLQHRLTTATGHFSAAALLDASNFGSEAPGAHSPGEFESPVQQQRVRLQHEGDADGQENAPPAAAAAVHLARPIPSTQMTVPETPSPEIGTGVKAAEVPLGRRVHLLSVAARNVDVHSPGKGRVAKAARTSNLQHGSAGGNGGGFSDVCAHAERLFAAIKQSVAAQAAPVTLKAAFLEPLEDRLASELCVALLGKKDDDFMGYFTTLGALEALLEARDALQKRVEGLTRMKDEFGELARAL